MESSALTAVLLPMAVGVIMLGLGLTLTVADFRRVVAYPKAVVVGLVCHVVLMPAVCFALVWAWKLPPALAVGMMLLAATPGGPMGNLFTHLANGDVALGITLTAVNSALSLLTLPLIVNLSLAALAGEGRVLPLQLDRVLQVFAVMLLPVALGMWVRARAAAAARKLERPVRMLSTAVLTVAIVGVAFRQGAHLVEAFAQVGPAALGFNLASLAVGYLVPRLLRLSQRQSVAIGMQLGIHNGALAIAIASSPLLLNAPAMAIPAAIYSVVMFFTAVAFGLLANPGRRAGGARSESAHPPEVNGEPRPEVTSPSPGAEALAG